MKSPDKAKRVAHGLAYRLIGSSELEVITRAFMLVAAGTIYMVVSQNKRSPI